MLSKNLVMLRGRSGLSQEQLAEKLGISRQAYAKWERGDTVPDVEKCARLAELYGVTLDALVNFSAPAAADVPPPPKGKFIFGTVTLSERGQIVIPKAAREVFALRPGERLVVLGDIEQGIALTKAESFFAQTRQLVALAEISADEE